MKKFLSFIVIASIAMLLLKAQTSFALLYQWVDEAGQVHISDEPRPRDQANDENIVNMESNQPYSPTDSKPEISRQSDAMPFSTETQPQRVTQKNYLQSQTPKVDVIPQPQMVNQLPVEDKAIQQSMEQEFELTSMSSMLAEKMMLIGLVHIVLSILTLIDVMKSEFNDSTNMVLWVLLVLSLPLLGILLYFSIGRQQRIGQMGDMELEMPRRRPRKLDM